MKETIIEWVKIILPIFISLSLLGFIIFLNEEPPHKITINGKKYIRTKEYIGGGHYQIILLPDTL